MFNMIKTTMFSKKTVPKMISLACLVLFGLSSLTTTYALGNTPPIKITLEKNVFTPGEEMKVTVDNAPTDKKLSICLTTKDRHSDFDTFISDRSLFYEPTKTFTFLAPNKKGKSHFEIVDSSTQAVLYKSSDFEVSSEVHDTKIDDPLYILDRPFDTGLGGLNFLRQGNKVTGIYEFNQGRFTGEITDKNDFGYAINGSFEETALNGDRLTGNIFIKIYGDGENWEITWKRSDSQCWSKSTLFPSRMDTVSNGLRVEWVPENQKAFNIYRQAYPDNQPPVKLNNEPVQNNEFIDTGYVPNQTYTYIIKAINADQTEKVICTSAEYVPPKLALIELKPTYKIGFREVTKMNFVRIRNAETYAEFELFEKKPNHDQAGSESRILNGKLMLPLRECMERIFQSKVTWNAKLKAIEVQYKNQQCKITLEKKEFTVNGKSYAFTNPPSTCFDTAHVEIKTLLDALGIKTQWYKEQSVLTALY